MLYHIYSDENGYEWARLPNKRRIDLRLNAANAAISAESPQSRAVTGRTAVNPDGVARTATAVGTLNNIAHCRRC